MNKRRSSKIEGHRERERKRVLANKTKRTNKKVSKMSE